MGLRYLFHFCSAEGGQKYCTLEIFLPGCGKKRQKNRILQTNFESKRVELPKEFDFSFFSQITFFMFCYVFWRFWQKKKNFVFFYKKFQNIVKFQIVRQFEKNDVLVENKMKYHDNSKLGYRRCKWKRYVFSYNLQKIS